MSRLLYVHVHVDLTVHGNPNFCGICVNFKLQGIAKNQRNRLEGVSAAKPVPKYVYFQHESVLAFSIVFLQSAHRML